MAIKRPKPEEIVLKLRQVEVLMGQGMPRIDAIRQVSVTEQTYYRWKKKYGGVGTEQLTQLERHYPRFLNQELWVNYLYQFSGFVDKPIHEVVQLTFYWKKFSTFSNVKENLLSHDLSIVVARIGRCRQFQLIQPLSLCDKQLLCSFYYNNIKIKIQIEVTSNNICEEKVCSTKFKYGDHETFDFVLEKIDKLAVSLQLFSGVDQYDFAKNYAIIRGVNLLMNKLQG